MEAESQSLKNLEFMRRNNEFCDFTIKVGSRSFNVHRIVLAACSDYFHGMLSHGMKEVGDGVVEMKGVHATAMEHCIKYMYTGVASIQQDDMEEFFIVADLILLKDAANLVGKLLSSPIVVNSDQHFKTIARSFNVLREEGFLCDFTIDILEKSIPAHRIILAAASDYFRQKCLELTGASDSVRLDYLDFAAVQICVEYVYAGQARITDELAGNALEAGKLFGLSGLTRTCLKHLENNLCERNCIAMIKLAQKLSIRTLCNEAEKIAQHHFVDIIKTEDFPLLSYAELIRVAQNTQADIVVKWEAAKTWFEHNPDRHQHFDAVFKQLGLQYLPFNFILNEVWENSLIAQSSTCQRILSEKLFASTSTLRANLDVSNCVLLYQIATERHPLNEKEACQILKCFMLNNLEKIDTTPLPSEDIISILDSTDAGQCSEVEKWNTLLKWTKHDRSRRPLFSKIISLIDFNRLPNEFLQETVLNERLMKKRKDVVKSALLSQKDQAQTYYAHFRHHPGITILDKRCGRITSLDVNSGQTNFLAEVRKSDFMRIVTIRKQLYLLNDRQILRLNDNGDWKMVAECVHTPDSRAQIVTIGKRIYILEKRKLYVCDLQNATVLEKEFDKRLEFGFCCAATNADIYVMGGIMDGTDVKRYNVETHQWSAVSPMNSKRCEATAVTMNDKIYVAGGSSFSTCERFDLRTKTWDWVASTTVRRIDCDSCVADGKIYVVGGMWHASREGFSADESVEVYEESLNKWTFVTNISPFNGGVSVCRC